MILSASRRTDIPCCYSDWFMNRIREGYVLTRNPLNHAQISRVPLNTDVIDCIVFWTKDPQPMLSHLDELDQQGYQYYFQFTLTPYGPEIERNLRPKRDIEQTFIELSKRIGRSRVVWRYDPIILNEWISISDHKENFERMCTLLAPFTDTVTISFVDLYAKNRHAPLREISSSEIEELSWYIAQTAQKHGLIAAACCEAKDLTQYGIQRASCIDSKRIERICGSQMSLKKDKNQRTGCGCCESIDIGLYNTCANGCVYCYANTSSVSATQRYTNHDPSSAILIGTVSQHESICERALASNKISQLSLFDHAVYRR